MKTFDIVICCYNSEKKIVDVLNQIFRCNQIDSMVSYVICVDNNSSDSTFSILKIFQETHKNLIVLQEKKQGLSFARKKGVDFTVSDWIVFLDDDNLVSRNWFIEASKFTSLNKHIGAFNGTVIPQIKDKLSFKEKVNLSLAYKGLACTHLSKNEIDFESQVHPNGEPFGAGLVIKGQEMRDLANQGWLKNVGRKGNILVSGEDGEMVSYIKRKYKTGFNPKMIILHIIEKRRLNIEYLTKLYKSFYNFYKTNFFSYPLIFMKLFLKTKLYFVLFVLIKLFKPNNYFLLTNYYLKSIF